jgi:hypothetical protein
LERLFWYRYNSCRLERADISGGIDLVRRFEDRCNNCSFDRADTSEGIILERLFWYRFNTRRELRRAEIWEGIDPVRLFEDSCNNCRFNRAETPEGIVLERLFWDRSKLVKPVSALIDEDMVPCKLLELKTNWDTSPLPPQVTPVQGVTGSDPVPQGALVAMATEQSQPLILE